MALTIEGMQDRIKKQVPLGPFTTFHIGGNAELFVQVDTEEEFIVAVEAAHREKMPFFLLGGGSNLVISDQGVPGLVMRNQARDRVQIDAKRGLVTLSSGMPLAEVVDIALRNGLSGMEPFTGIPGTFGGAIYGNAGAYGQCVADILVGADILTQDGRICRVNNSFFEFAYRTSALKKVPFYVVNATLKLAPGVTEDIKTKMKEIMVQRNTKHPPMKIGSAGSYFKNLDPLPGDTRRRAAGEILEKAGAKSMMVGGASVYEKHANFIVNYGKATAEDVKQLAHLMKTKVLEMFGVELHEEVIYLGG